MDHNEDWAESAARKICHFFTGRSGSTVLLPEFSDELNELAEIIREESLKEGAQPEGPVLDLAGGPIHVPSLDTALHMLLEHGSVKIINCDGKASPSMLEIGAWLAHLGKEGK
jgi:hypothetical protein